MAQLVCKNLILGYEGKPVVDNLSFTVERGEYLCIVGDNGSGKSTLMRTLLRLQPPLEGTIEFGEDLRADQIGYLPQQTAIQRDFPASVSEIVLSGCLNRCGISPFYNRTLKQLAQANMEKMGINYLAHRCYRELSGGQQQRVLLARALCSTERMLLLDEPTAGLDPKVTIELYELIRCLNNEDGITVIMISHDLASALKYASHILHIGKPCFFGQTGEYISRFAKETYLTEGQDL
jgi:ABC-type Mn/Zn transport systems, ATPase component